MLLAGGGLTAIFSSEGNVVIEEGQTADFVESFYLKEFAVINTSDNELDYNYEGDWGNNAMWESEPFNWDPATYYYNWDFPDITNRIRKNNTQELRFSLNNIVFGLFYSELEEKDDRSGYFFNGDYDYMTSEFNIDNSAIYAKYFRNLTKNLTIDLSFRFDKYKTTNDLYYLASYYGNFGEDFLTIDDENLGWPNLYWRITRALGKRGLLYLRHYGFKIFCFARSSTSFSFNSISFSASCCSS